MLLPLIAAFLSPLASAGATVPSQAPEIPIYYSYGGYPKISTNISWGTPAQKAIPAVFDLGSIGFWVYGPDAIINDGSDYIGGQGPCNFPVQQYFDWPKSSTHSAVVNLTKEDVYSYGGNGKIVTAPQVINDTISFGAGPAPINNTQVALANFTAVRELDPGCTTNVNSFDQSILGMGPFGVGGSLPSSVGPSFRTNLYDQGRISAQILSVWMKKGPADVRGTYHGSALFGEGLPKTAYSGELVAIEQSPPVDQAYVGYYSAAISLSANGQSVAESGYAVMNNYTDCLIDSGTGQDVLPFNSTSLASVSQVYNYNSPDGLSIYVWNGTCESIPFSATLDYHFLGATAGKDALVKVPVRSYARGTADGYSGVPDTVCPLAISLDSPTCVLGAPFFTAAALQFDDDSGEILVGQGGVA